MTSVQVPYVRRVSWTTLVVTLVLPVRRVSQCEFQKKIERAAYGLEKRAEVRLTSQLMALLLERTHAKNKTADTQNHALLMPRSW